MTQLGVSVTTRLTPPTSGIPTATDTWFVVAVTTSGTLNVPAEVHDIVGFEAAFGSRSGGNIPLWDAMDVFFREGGKRAFVVRCGAGTQSAALAALPKTLGPGQVSLINSTPDAAAYTLLINHAIATNRFALMDVTDIPDLAGLTTLANAVTDPGGYGALFGPWVVVPAPSGSSGLRRVPASPVIAALCARMDQSGNPNQAAAGRWLPLQFTVDLGATFTDADRLTLLDLGLNTMAEVYGVLENYGFQSAVTESADNPFWQANCGRMRMALVARSQAIGEEYMFRPIDGQGILADGLRTDLEAMLLSYFNVNALFGATPRQAFAVDVGSTVNTIDTIAQGRLRAVAQVVLSLHAKAIEIELVTVPVGGAVT